jgi:hypothetical protein
MARPKKRDEEEDYFVSLPKVGPSYGAPWYLISSSGVLLAYSPFVEAANQTAVAMWGDIALVLKGELLEVISEGRMVGRIVPRKLAKVKKSHGRD